MGTQKPLDKASSLTTNWAYLAMLLMLGDDPMTPEEVEEARRTLLFWRWKYQVQHCEPPLRHTPSL